MKQIPEKDATKVYCCRNKNKTTSTYNSMNAPHCDLPRLFEMRTQKKADSVHRSA